MTEHTFPVVFLVNWGCYNAGDRAWFFADRVASLCDREQPVAIRCTKDKPKAKKPAAPAKVVDEPKAEVAPVESTEETEPKPAKKRARLFK